MTKVTDQIWMDAIKVTDQIRADAINREEAQKQEAMEREQKLINEADERERNLLRDAALREERLQKMHRLNALTLLWGRRYFCKPQQRKNKEIWQGRKPTLMRTQKKTGGNYSSQRNWKKENWGRHANSNLTYWGNGKTGSRICGREGNGKRICN